MKRLLLLLITLVIISCEMKTQSHETPSHINLGDIFNLCDTVRKCGNEFYCNPSELYLIDNKTFCLIDYSEIPYANKNMYGTYQLNKDSLSLTFNSNVVIFGIKWEGEPYVSDMDTYFKETEEKIGPLYFKIGSCENGALMLTNDQVRKYGLGFKTMEDAKSKMAELLESKEWEKLNN